ncbi:WG repeat-containing protein [Chryseobacterium sp. A301]
MKLLVRNLILILVFISLGISGQNTSPKSSNESQKSQYEKINDSIPGLIPRKTEGKFGYVNQSGEMVIPAQYKNVGFFTTDCKLLNSPNEKVREYGSDAYASVRTVENVDYRIDKSGKKVYRFKEQDLGKCPYEYKAQLYHSYVRSGFYGVIDRSKFENEMDYRQYIIYPQFQYLHIMEGDDLKNPMIIATYDNRFGVIDIEGNIIIPFRYADIKRNFSWKLARLFEVSKDGKEYYFVDRYNNRY